MIWKVYFLWFSFLFWPAKAWDSISLFIWKIFWSFVSFSQLPRKCTTASASSKVWIFIWLLYLLLELESPPLPLKLKFFLSSPPRDEAYFAGSLLKRACALNISVIYPRKSLPNNSFPKFYNNVFWSAVIDFAWLEFSMEPAPVCWAAYDITWYY